MLRQDRLALLEVSKSSSVPIRVAATYFYRVLIKAMLYAYDL